MMTLWQLFLLYTLAASAQRIHEAVLIPRDVNRLPTEDDFYTEPKNLLDKPPGSILRIRDLRDTVQLTEDDIFLKQTYQIMFRTEDANGVPAAAVSTVFIPKNANFSRLVSYQIPEDAVSLDCSPSFALVTDFSSARSWRSYRKRISQALENGWVISAPDYEGLQSSFAVGAQAGKATLDGIRATLQLSEFSCSMLKTEIALWGYSGGAIATLWAAELHATYAPETNIVVAVAGGVTPQFDVLLNGPSYSWTMPLLIAGMHGIMTQNSDLRAYVAEHLLPEKKERFDVALTQCFEENMRTYILDKMEDYFDEPAFADNPIISRALKEQALGHRHPDIPLHIHQAYFDEITPIESVDELVDKYCGAGVIVDYHRVLLAEHASEAFLAIDDVIDVLQNVFQGRVPGECSRSTDMARKS